MKKHYFKSLMQVALLLAAPFVVSSCDDVIGQEDNPVASYVQWKTDADKAEISLKIGSTYTRTATAVSSALIAYESDNTEIASVDPVSGEVKALKEGSANISAVISGMSTNGRNVFEATKLTYKVNVIDKKAYMAAKVDSVLEYTANVDSVIKLSKLFTAFGAAANGVTYTEVVPTGATAKFTGGELATNGDLTISATSISGVDATHPLIAYIEAKISTVDTPDFDDNPNADLKKDTIKIHIDKAIAYINEQGKRTILTADKYKELSVGTIASADTTFKPGIYFVDINKKTTGLSDLKVKAGGDITFILGNTVNWSIQNLVDADDAYKLNIFVQADEATSPGGTTMKAKGTLLVNRSSGGDAITNFKEINVYGGTLEGRSTAANCGGFAAIKNLNVKGGKVIAINSSNGYGISLADGGKLTIAGGEVEAVGTGSSTTFGFALIGDVEVSKGKFAAQNPDYRAVKGNMTAGGKIKFKTSANGSTYTALEGATSNAPYVKAE